MVMSDFLFGEHRSEGGQGHGGTGWGGAGRGSAARSDDPTKEIENQSAVNGKGNNTAAKVPKTIGGFSLSSNTGKSGV
jgi:hypothetical protein